MSEENKNILHVCAWCEPGQKYMKEIVDVTHGICNIHSKQLMQQINETFNTELKQHENRQKKSSGAKCIGVAKNNARAKGHGTGTVNTRAGECYHPFNCGGGQFVFTTLPDNSHE